MSKYKLRKKKTKMMMKNRSLENIMCPKEHRIMTMLKMKKRSEPTRITKHVFLGSIENANDGPTIRRLRIKHVVHITSSRDPNPELRTLVIREADDEKTNLRQHFKRQLPS